METDRKDQTPGGLAHHTKRSLHAAAMVIVGPFLATAGSLARVARDPDTRNILTASGLLLLSGMVLFRFIEDLGWLDALYFSFITLSTIGFGDITPTTELGKVVTIVYSIAGLGILAALINAIASHGPRRSQGTSDGHAN